MKKILMRLRSPFGNILDVIKHDREYMLVTQNGMISVRRHENDEEGVTQIKAFVDSLQSYGWTSITK